MTWADPYKNWKQHANTSKCTRHKCGNQTRSFEPCVAVIGFAQKTTIHTDVIALFATSNLLNSTETWYIITYN